MKDQLLVAYEGVVKAMDSGLVVNRIYLDFSKAFDVINRYIVLENCKCSSLAVNFLFGFVVFGLVAQFGSRW